MPRLRFRHAHLRPSYLVLIDAESEDDPRGRLFYLWADRLRRQGLQVDLRLFKVGDPEEAPLCFRSTQSGWRDAGRQDQHLDRLEDPPFGQRLVVVSNGASLVSEDSEWREWALRARFHRWRERVLFTPVDPRDWGPREEAIERSERIADPGFLVLPLDDGALRAWSDLLTTGQLPEIVLSEPQRYPRLIQQLDKKGDDELVNDLSTLIPQLMLYLGENGLYWLAAGLTARQLALRAPPSWSRWLPKLRLDGFAGAHWRERLGWVGDWLGALWARLAYRNRLPFSGGASRTWVLAAALLALWLTVLAGVYFIKPDNWPKSLGDLLFEARVRAIGFRHQGPVVSAAFSPDGRRVVTASRDGTARLWDAETGAAVGATVQHKGPVNHAAFSPDGRRVMTASEDRTARLWDAETGAAVGKRRPHEGPVNHGAFSPDGRRVVTASDDGTARLWDVETGAALGATLQHEGAVTQAVFSPDGRRVATASDDRTAQLWDGKSAPAPSIAPPEFDRGSRWLHGAIDALIPREGGVARWVTAGLFALAAMTIRGLRLRRRVARLALGTAGSRA